MLIPDKILKGSYEFINSNKIIFFSIVISLCAAFILTSTYYYYVPLAVDGGWYSAPANALARGSDPLENQMTLAQVSDIEGVKPIFGFDTRSIRTLPMSWWFSIHERNIWWVKVFSILELSLLFFLFYLLTKRNIKSKAIALFCWCIYVTDSTVISLGGSDLRPDLLVTALAILVFMSFENPNNLIWFLIGSVSVFIISAVHVTAAVPIALLLTYLFLKVIVFKNRNKSNVFDYLYSVLIVCLAVLGFFFRERVVNFLVPTDIKIISSVDVVHRSSSILSNGLTGIAAKEIDRWSNYFFISNMAEFIFILFGFVVAAYIIIQDVKKYLGNNIISNSSDSFIALFFACGTSLLVLALFDPHITEHHAVPIVPFLVLLTGKIFDSLDLQGFKEASLKSILFGLVLLSFMLKIALSAKIIYKAETNEFNNQILLEYFNKKISLDARYLAIGPTELWPYINQNANLVMMDKRNKIPSEIVDLLNKVDLVFLNKEFQSDVWENELANINFKVDWVNLGEVGGSTREFYFTKLYESKRK